jgi:16S rRNA processing protein RimM
MGQKEKLILIGVISAAHGIQGHVLVKSYSNPPENIDKLPLFDENNEPIELKVIRSNSKGLLVCSVVGSDDRNKAEELKGRKFYCHRKDFPAIDDEEFYIEDLLNLRVLNETGDEIGKIIEVVNYGAGDIIEIKFKNDSSEMFPFTKELFPIIEKDHIVFVCKQKLTDVNL